MNSRIFLREHQVRPRCHTCPQSLAVTRKNGVWRCQRCLDAIKARKERK